MNRHLFFKYMCVMKFCHCFTFSLGASLLWSSVIMLMFKYQQCGTDSYPEDQSIKEQKKPLVNHIHDEFKPSFNAMKDGDRIIV